MQGKESSTTVGSRSGVTSYNTHACCCYGQNWLLRTAAALHCNMVTCHTSLLICYYVIPNSPYRYAVPLCSTVSPSASLPHMHICTLLIIIAISSSSSSRTESHYMQIPAVKCRRTRALMPLVCVREFRGQREQGGLSDAHTYTPPGWLNSFSTNLLCGPPGYEVAEYASPPYFVFYADRRGGSGSRSRRPQKSENPRTQPDSWPPHLHVPWPAWKPAYHPRPLTPHFPPCNLHAAAVRGSP